MAEQQDKKQPPKAPHSTIFASVRRAIAPLSSPLLLDALSAYPLFGNLAIALLLGGVAASGYFLFDKADQINPASMCQQLSTSSKVRAQLNHADSLQITSAEPIATQQEDALFSCEFNVVTASDNRENREKVSVVYQVVRDDLVRSIADEKIARQVLENICEDESYYTQALASQGYDPKLHEVKLGGLVLEDEANNEVYPVFRWKCQYQLVAKDNKKTNKPTIQAPNYLVGLDLDKYCEDNFTDKGLIRARYHHYNDPNSLYCVNPNF